MFWRMTGLSTVSPVDTILDKDHYTLEELLDEDEIIQECKALNTRLINFLRDRAQVERLLHYIVEESPEDAETKRTFKFPFVACEIFTCEVDIILRTLVEDEELMNLLFSFLKPERPHSSLLSGYFSKVVICLTLRKTTSLMSYVKGHQEIYSQLVDLIGITSIMEVLIRLIGADEKLFSNYADAMQWLEDTEVLELIVDKFSSSDHREVHANAAEVLCAITRYAPGLAAKICSPNFVGRLFRHTLEDARPKSVLVHSLSVCMSLLDPKRLGTTTYQPFRSQQSHGSLVTASPETVEVMLESLGQLLKLLDVSSSEPMLPTTYGTLEPPLGIHRLKIVEFISVLLKTGNAAAEKELIRLGAIKHILDMFFRYPFNNFLHNHVDSILTTCLDSKTTILTEHLLQDCEIVSKVLAAEKQPTLSTDSKPTVSAERRSQLRIGNIGHITRIANKLIQLGNNSSMVQTHLQENNEWVDWHTNILLKRNAVENVNQWTCGRPTTLHDRTRDSDDDDFRDRDYDVAALASNLSQAFRYGIYSNDDIEEAHRSLERDDEDVYFDDESAEVVISSLRLGDDQDSSSLFTNSNWFAFEEDREANARSAGSLPSPSPNSDETNQVTVNENEDLVDKATSLHSSDSVPVTSVDKSISMNLENGPAQEPSKEETRPSISPEEGEKPTEWVEWRETSHSDDLPHEKPVPDVHYGQTVEGEQDHTDDNIVPDGICELPTYVTAESLPESSSGSPCTNPHESPESLTSELSNMSSTDAAIDHVEHKKEAIENDSE